MQAYQEPLFYEDRCLRTQTGKLLFGPAGDRLAVDVLDKRPGFSGCIDFIHKMNLSQLFTVTDSAETDYSQAEYTWYPDRMTVEYEAEELSFREVKTITAEDIAASAAYWENRSDKPLAVSFCCSPKGLRVGEDVTKEGFCLFAESAGLRFGITVGIAAGWSAAGGRLVIEPGQRAEVLMAAAVGNLASERAEEIRRRRDSCLSGEGTPWEILEQMIRKNGEFYRKAPSFRCDDRLINACWQYRWYILRNSMCRPRFGNFQETVMYEGRDHRMTKTPLEPKGWEFSKLIPLSTPLQINDLRWHPERELTREIIRSAFAGQDGDGLLLCAYVKTADKSYANYMLWAVWLFYSVDGDKELIRELLPAMKKYIAGHEKHYQDKTDSLLTERIHSLTGKEYQPSYWYFSGYPKNPKDPAGYTPLKRVDRSVYHYLNLKGLSRLMRAVGEDGSEYERKAEKLRAEINGKMWDEETGFYYDLHCRTGEKAMVRNIVGVYPFWAEMAERGQEKGILPLMDPEAFDTGAAFPSVSRDCPAFSPSGGWMGNFIKGRNGCVWCGPSWPYTTGIALEALGNESRRGNHCYDRAFDRFLMQYTRQHFRDGDYRRPYLVEHYDSITGERLSDEADYNHSFWLDLIITYVAGLVIKEDSVEISPLRTHLKWFELEGLSVRGHSIRIAWSQEERKNRKKGLTVTVDREETFFASDGESVMINI